MRVCLALLLALCALPATAQDPADLPFTVELVEEDITGMPGLHSFAWAEHDGRWLFVAGRADGLHAVNTNLEPVAFPTHGANNTVWVVDLAADQVWSRSLNELHDAVTDPLRATNVQFHQEGETLYVIGGYGTDSATSEKITFPILTAIDVPGLIEAVTTGGDLAPHLRQTTDERLAVTGGELRPLFPDFNLYLLIGGQRFDGEYSLSGVGFTQTYTDAIRYFLIADDGGTLAIEEYNAWVLPDLFHRRDLIVAPIIVENNAGGHLGWQMYGGVFRPDVNLPFLTPIEIYPDDLAPFGVEEFGEQQRLANYTAPALALYDRKDETMHTTFFGGMSQFYVNNEGAIVEDLLVPFVDHVSTWSQGNGMFAETVMPIRMPGLLGTNAALIPAPGVPHYENGVVQLGDLTTRTLVGWIVGGIVSTAPNPGWFGMTDEQTAASDRIFAVYVTPTFDVATEPAAVPATIAFEVPFPNPVRTESTVAFVLNHPADVTVEVFDMMGRRVALLHEGPLGMRRHAFSFRPGDLPAGVYYARVHGDGFSETRSLVRVR